MSTLSVPLTACEILCKLTYSLPLCLNITIEDGCCDCYILIVFIVIIAMLSLTQQENCQMLCKWSRKEKGHKGWWGLGLEDLSPKRLLSEKSPSAVGAECAHGPALEKHKMCYMS